MISSFVLCCILWWYGLVQNVYAKLSLMHTQKVSKLNASVVSYHYLAHATWALLYIMLTGFPPYDMPTRQDDRFEIICSGKLMRQLQAWESECLIVYVCILILKIESLSPLSFLVLFTSLPVRRGRSSVAMDAVSKSRAETNSGTGYES